VAHNVIPLKHGDKLTKSFPLKFPAGLGYEAAGTVDAVGKEVGGFVVGDKVNVIPSFSLNDYSTYGEVILVPDHAVVRQPKSLSFTEAASVWMMFVTAYGGARS
jgi:NADPH:quinone reductase-like Zn-dependent oxidoreductase